VRLQLDQIYISIKCPAPLEIVIGLGTMAKYDVFSPIHVSLSAPWFNLSNPGQLSPQSQEAILTASVIVKLLH
jgi:hypothetical protein